MLEVPSHDSARRRLWGDGRPLYTGVDAVPVSSHSDRAALSRDSTALPTWGGGDNRIPKESQPYYAPGRKPRLSGHPFKRSQQQEELEILCLFAKQNIRLFRLQIHLAFLSN